MWQNSVGASRLRHVFLCLLALSFGNSCTDNLLSEMSSQTSNEALLVDVKIALNSQNYTTAVTKCEQMTPAFLLDSDAAYTCASALAGRAGLNLISLVTNLAAYSAPPNFLPYMMALNLGVTAQDLSDLDNARDLLRGLGGAADRTGDQNALMTLIAIHSLGVVSGLYADLDDDGFVDAGYDSCDSVTDLPAGGGLSVTNALWEIKESAGSSNIPGGSGLVTLVTTACTALDAINPNMDFCAETDPTAFTVDHVRGARSFISEDTAQFGLADTCAGQTLPVCFCP